MQKQIAETLLIFSIQSLNSYKRKVDIALRHHKIVMDVNVSLDGKQTETAIENRLFHRHVTLISLTDSRSAYIDELGFFFVTR